MDTPSFFLDTLSAFSLGMVGLSISLVSVILTKHPFPDPKNKSQMKFKLDFCQNIVQLTWTDFLHFYYNQLLIILLIIYHLLDIKTLGINFHLWLLDPYLVEMFYLNSIEQLFFFVEQLDQLEVCLPLSRLLSGIPILAVFQNLRWNSNKTYQSINLL